MTKPFYAQTEESKKKFAKRKANQPTLREKLKKVLKNVNSETKTFSRRKRSPMEKERVVDTMKSKFKGIIGDFKTAEEMDAATKGLKTLTSKGPGRLKLALRGGGRAYDKNS